jgi:hypothetical protein
VLREFFFILYAHEIRSALETQGGGFVLWQLRLAFRGLRTHAFLRVTWSESIRPLLNPSQRRYMKHATIYPKAVGYSLDVQQLEGARTMDRDVGQHLLEPEVATTFPEL